MANETILMLPNVPTALNGSEAIEIVQNGTSYQTTSNAIAQLYTTIGTLPTISAGYLLGNATTGSAPATGTSMSSLLDVAFGSTQGGILYRGVGNWNFLQPASSAGYALLSGGPNADPYWQAEPGFGTVQSVGVNTGSSNTNLVTKIGSTISTTNPITAIGTISIVDSPSFTSLTLTNPLTAANGGTGIASLGTGIATWLGTPSSANLAAAVTDETGSGLLVFNNGPTFIAPVLGAASATSLTSAIIYGGSGTGSSLTLQSTSGNGSTDSIVMKVGNNGAITALTASTTGQVTVPFLATSSSISVTPVLSFNASNASFVSGASVSGSYLQSLLQNKSGTAGASTNYVLSNDLGTDSTYYGEFGMNSSVFSSGTPSDFFSINNGVYFSGHDGDITIGSGNGFKTYFAWGSAGGSAHVINASGALGFNTNLAATSGTTGFGTSGQPLISGGSSASPAWGTLALGTANTNVSGTLTVTNGGTGSGTLTLNGVLYGNGTSALGVTAAGTTGQVFVGTTSSAPSWTTALTGLTTVTATGAITFNTTTNNQSYTTTGAGTITINSGTTGSITNMGISGSTGSFTTLTASSTVTLSPASANVLLQPTGTGVVTIGPATLGTINNMSVGATTASTGAFTTVTASTSVLSPGAGGIGYSTGAGGTVTQGTSKATAVSLSKITGQITMNGAALAAGTIVSFTLTNTTIAATDFVLVQHSSVGTLGSYTCTASPAAGSAVIYVRNNSAASLSEAIVLQFVVIKAVTA